MKYCKFDGLRYPDEMFNCVACGGTLVADTLIKQLGEQTDMGFATSCCPEPTCPSLVAPAKTNFCAMCGTRLQPISYELWINKFVKAALAERTVDTLLDPSDLFRRIAELGLSKDRAEEQLNLIFKERIGVERNVLNRWIEETVLLLNKDDDKLEGAKLQAIWRARRLNIALLDASLIVERLANTKQIVLNHSAFASEAANKKERITAKQNQTGVRVYKLRKRHPQ